MYLPKPRTSTDTSLGLVFYEYAVDGKIVFFKDGTEGNGEEAGKCSFSY